MKSSFEIYLNESIWFYWNIWYLQESKKEKNYRTSLFGFRRYIYITLVQSSNMVRKYLKSLVDTNGKWALVSKCIRRDVFLRLLREWNARKNLFCQMINLSMYQSLSFLFGMERSSKRNWILEKKCGEVHNSKESLNLTGWCCI